MQTTPSRSPLGAFVRSPLGVRGGGVLPIDNPILVSGHVPNAVSWEYTFNLNGVWYYVGLSGKWNQGSDWQTDSWGSPQISFIPQYNECGVYGPRRWIGQSRIWLNWYDAVAFPKKGPWKAEWKKLAYGTDPIPTFTKLKTAKIESNAIVSGASICIGSQYVPSEWPPAGSDPNGRYIYQGKVDTDVVLKKGYWLWINETDPLWQMRINYSDASTLFYGYQENRSGLGLYYPVDRLVFDWTTRTQTYVNGYAACHYATQPYTYKPWDYYTWAAQYQASRNSSVSPYPPLFPAHYPMGNPPSSVTFEGTGY